MRECEIEREREYHGQVHLVDYSISILDSCIFENSRPIWRFGSTFCMPKLFKPPLRVDNDKQFRNCNCRHWRPETIALQRKRKKLDVPEVERIQGWVQATELAILDTFRSKGNAGVFNHGGGGRWIWVEWYLWNFGGGGGGTGRNQSHSRRSCKMNGAYLENFPRLSESEMPRMQDWLTAHANVGGRAEV
jgi:hypothetical protein